MRCVTGNGGVLCVSKDPVFRFMPGVVEKKEKKKREKKVLCSISVIKESILSAIAAFISSA